MVRENFGIGVFFLGPIKLRYETQLTDAELSLRLEDSAFFKKHEKGKFSAKLTVFQKVFPFNHFVTIKGRCLKNNVIEITIAPIFVRVMQLTIVSMAAITLSAVRLYENQSWKVLGIAGVHFGVLCTVWFVLRILYVADARTKIYRTRKHLKLSQEV
ncbi:MAG: hypothetical protein KDC92_15095 [Bacteroidetes bacterium]|nr:hypothetical protein [Bacteroidota bacterium]